MAGREQNLSADAHEMQKQQLKETKKQFRQEQKNQKKEAKKRARELEEQERELDEQIEGGSVPVVIVTLFIVLIWLGILCLLIKMDVGGFGSNVLTPILKDVPVINKILPSETSVETKDEEAYGGYSSLKEAVEQIKELELQLDQAQSANTTYTEQIEQLKAEVERLKTFEDNQVEFQRVKEKFYEEVVYAENGPGPDEYQKYYEEMDPTTAEELYKEVVQTTTESQKMKEYATTFSNMQASEAAAILGSMTDNLELAAQILQTLDVTNRGAIMGAMDPAVAARITKIMDPNS